MSRVRDIANILSGGSSAIATDAEITSAVSNQFVAGKNKIINGDFGIWQRGTSFTPTSDAFTADRYKVGWNGTGATRTISQQTFTPGEAPVSGYEGSHFIRINQSVAGTGGTYNSILQPIENVRTFAGQTITFSFWAKANNNISVSGGFGQVFGSGGSSSVYSTDVFNINLTTSWQRFTYTATLPSVSGKTIGTTNSKLEIFIQFPSNTTFTIDTWGWQVEAGSIATNFATATGTIQGELAACQRYYLLVASGVGAPIAAAWYPTSTAMSTIVNFPVEMRTSSPTLVQTTGTGYYNVYAVAGNDALNSLTIDVRSSRACLLYNNTEASGTAGSTGNSVTNNASSILALSAEL